MEEKPNGALIDRWMLLYQTLCDDEGADPVEAVNAMLTAATVLCETVHGARDAAARLAVTAGVFAARAEAQETPPMTEH